MDFFHLKYNKYDIVTDKSFNTNMNLLNYNDYKKTKPANKIKQIFSSNILHRKSELLYVKLLQALKPKKHAYFYEIPIILEKYFLKCTKGTEKEKTI